MIPNYPSKCINQKSNFLEVVSAPNQAQPELFSRHFQSFSIVFLRWVINFNEKFSSQKIDENFPTGPLDAHCSLSSALQPTFSVFSFLLRWLALLKTFFIGTSFKSNTVYIEHSFYRSLPTTCSQGYLRHGAQARGEVEASLQPEGGDHLLLPGPAGRVVCPEGDQWDFV